MDSAKRVRVVAWERRGWIAVSVADDMCLKIARQVLGEYVGGAGCAKLSVKKWRKPKVKMICL